VHADDILIACLPGNRLLRVVDIHGYAPSSRPLPCSGPFADRRLAPELDVETVTTGEAKPPSVTEPTDILARALAGAGQRGGWSR